MNARQGLLLLIVLPLASEAQVFWTEDFNNGCTQSCTAVGYTSVNGTWTQTVTGVEGADPNAWYVSCAAEGRTPGNCGGGCSSVGPTTTGASLHVGGAIGVLGDMGAVYDAGGLCGILTCPQTDRRIESPTINCVGRGDIRLHFNYVKTGAPPNDDAEVWYFDGATWAQLINPTPTNNVGCGADGRWTGYAVDLPASANNNPNVRIGFRWVNNDDGVGTDPSIAIDRVELSTPFGDGFEG
jgi:hypothetical protein